MSFHSADTETQCVGDFFVGKAFPNESHDLLFSRGELAHHLCLVADSVGLFHLRGFEWEGRPFEDKGLRCLFKVNGDGTVFGRRAGPSTNFNLRKVQMVTGNSSEHARFNLTEMGVIFGKISKRALRNGNFNAAFRCHIHLMIPSPLSAHPIQTAKVIFLPERPSCRVRWPKVADYFSTEVDSDFAKRVLIERGVEEVAYRLRQVLEDMLNEFPQLRHCVTRLLDFVELLSDQAQWPDCKWYKIPIQKTSCPTGWTSLPGQSWCRLQLFLVSARSTRDVVLVRRFRIHNSWNRVRQRHKQVHDTLFH